MEEQGDPFRVVNIVVVITVLLACLGGLYFQDQKLVLGWLRDGFSCVGACVGGMFLVFVFGTIYGIISQNISKVTPEKLERQLIRHRARFTCHICGKPSSGPSEYWDQDGDDKGHLFSEYHVTDYDKPADLVQCARCHKWTCTDATPPHLVNGICEKCLESV